MAEIHQEWLQEFNEFSSIPSHEIPVPASAFVQIKSRIFPNPWHVLAKITVLHIFVGLLSLAVCNQFGLNPFQTSQSLTNWFMKIAGHQFCMLLCGTFFMATTYGLANFFLRLEEFEAIKKHEWLQTSVMSLVSLAAFYFFGAELAGSFVFLWLIGALIGGLISIESSYRLRRAMS